MIVDVPVLLPAVAVTLADPAATPVTRPLVETVATAVSDDAHVNDVAEPDGFAVATSCTVPPAAMVDDDGATDTDSTVFGGPNFGDRLSGAGVVTESEHAANAAAAAMNVTVAMTVVRVRMAS
jgi:hypothetical protein